MSKKHKSRSTWNYRLLAFPDHEDEYFVLHEVHYDKKGQPNGYSEPPGRTGGQSEAELLWVLGKMLKAVLQKGKRSSILWGGDRFPEKYKPKKNEV